MLALKKHIRNILFLSLKKYVVRVYPHKKSFLKIGLKQG